MKQLPLLPANVEVAEIDDRRALTETDDFDEDGPPIQCPTCGYEQPREFALKPRTYGHQPVDICVNCGQFMTFDPALDDADARFNGTHTPTPVLTTATDFARFRPTTCRQLLHAQSLTHKLARMRGYGLGKLKMRAGSA